jgi:MFS family permease
MSQIEPRPAAIISATIMLATTCRRLIHDAAVALPGHAGTFSATQDQVAWVLTSYNVAARWATPMAGYLGDGSGVRALPDPVVGHSDVDGLRVATSIARWCRSASCRLLRCGLLVPPRGDDARHVSPESDRRHREAMFHVGDAWTDPTEPART